MYLTLKAIIFFLFIECCTTREMVPDRQPKKSIDMQTSTSKIQLSGEEVTVSHISNPMISHGMFNLSNESENLTQIKVEEVYLHIGDKHKKILDCKFFNQTHEIAMESDNFQVASNTCIRFIVGFSRVAYTYPLGTPVSIVLKVKVNGKIISAISPVIMEKRIPRRL